MEVGLEQSFVLFFTDLPFFQARPHQGVLQGGSHGHRGGGSRGVDQGHPLPHSGHVPKMGPP